MGVQRLDEVGDRRRVATENRGQEAQALLLACDFAGDVRRADRPTARGSAKAPPMLNSVSIVMDIWVRTRAPYTAKALIFGAARMLCLL
jgi:hypothetical protein